MIPIISGKEYYEISKSDKFQFDGLAHFEDTYSAVSNRTSNRIECSLCCTCDVRLIII